MARATAEPALRECRHCLTRLMIETSLWQGKCDLRPGVRRLCRGRPKATLVIISPACPKRQVFLFDRRVDFGCRPQRAGRRIASLGNAAVRGNRRAPLEAAHAYLCAAACPAMGRRRNPTCDLLILRLARPCAPKTPWNNRKGRLGR